MEKELLNLTSGDATKDIDNYLCVSVAHLNAIILCLQKLEQDEDEKEHVKDILNECLYHKTELLNLQKMYNESNFLDKNNTLEKIINIIKNIFSIEEEVIGDYPQLFKNEDGQWWQYIESKNKNNTPITCEKVTQKVFKRKLRLKELAFGVFFLVPAFLIFLVYPWLSKLNSDDTNTAPHFVYENDRAYKNLFYIYSALLANQENENNFYSLIKSHSFKMPEGFVVVDKNTIVDYYLKEFYNINSLEGTPNTTIISVNNLNYMQCKYIITKFSGLALPEILLNGIPLSFTNDFKVEDHCLSHPHETNVISLHMRSLSS